VLGLEWLKHFDMHTKTHVVGVYRLLILDGHESHLNQDFKDYCLEHKILTFCMPPHSSHILQSLDVVCFLPLKRKYSQRVRDLARRRVFHINKEGFLPAFRNAFFDVFTEQNCYKAFESSGYVPLNSQVVLDCLEVRLRTLPASHPHLCRSIALGPHQQHSIVSTLCLLGVWYAGVQFTAVAR
jgi:hypothetical protein